MAAAKAEMPQVLKNRRNKQTDSNYADLEAIDKAISPVISKHGFALSFFPAKSDLPDHYAITCEVRHKAGHTVTHNADIPADEMGIKGTVNKTKTHAFGSTMAYGRRYMKTMIFDVATADDDGNAAGGDEPITEDQRADLLELIEETETDVSKFCKFLKINSVAEMPMSKPTAPMPMSLICTTISKSVYTCTVIGFITKHTLIHFSIPQCQSIERVQVQWIEVIIYF